MTPQDLVTTLLQANGERGRQLLQAHIPVFSQVALDKLVDLLKNEADHSWNTDVQQSFVLAGYLLFIGDLTHNKFYHALGLMARGDALRRMDCDQEALPFLDAAGEEFLALGDEVGWARTRIGRISACLRLNRTTEALRDAAAAREIFMRHDKLQRAGQMDASAAIVYFERGEYDAALHCFDRAIETYQLHGEDVDVNIARARANKALTLAAMGRFREAVALHEQARATFAEHGEREEISMAREELNIADIYAAQGYYSKALLLYDQSRTHFQNHNMFTAAAEVALQMCMCLTRLNRTRDAYELAEEAVTFFRSMPGQGDSLARALMHQATATTMERKFDEADELLQEASDLLIAGGFVRLAALARLRRADLYFADQQWEASMREAQHVADVFADQEDLPNLARATLLQARLAEIMKDNRTAHYLCEQALDIAQGQELLDLQYACYDLLGQLCEQADKLDEAAAYYERAMRGIDDVQSRLVLDERTSFLEDKGGIYQRAMLLALRRGLVDQALIYVEKAKSRVLGDYLRNNIDIRVRANDTVDENFLENLARLREEQAWFSSIVYETENEANLSDTAIMRIRAIGPVRAQQEMHKRERRIEQLLEQLQLRTVGDVVARARPDWTNSIMTSLRPRLEPRVLMLEYYLADQDIYVFQLTRDRIEVAHVPGGAAKLERLISLWRANLEVAAQAGNSPDRALDFNGILENGLGLLQRLYQMLLQPVEQALISCEHLIIVPYGMLHYVPFHCLFDGKRFMVERLYISYLPAASILDICRQRAERMRAKGLQLQRSVVMGSSDGGRLPFAVQEARRVALQLGARCAVNEEATTSLLWKAGAQAPIVHIAAHGLFRLDAPNFSHIKLADRVLSAIEVFNLDLSSCTLLTLSACETGRAVIGGVDEVIGLGRGFLYAGAASLLPTLWKVDDASSAELMEMFYRALLSGYPKIAALSGAQRAFLAITRASGSSHRLHPYFWGAFHLIGDPGKL
jgi:CHAT domain-containing protein